MQRAPTRKSLLRRVTWLGGDRRLVGFTGLAMFLLTWTMFMGLGFMWGLSLIVPLTIFLAVLWVARRINTADPWMIDIVRRQFKYQKYYAPKSDINVPHPQVRDFG